MIYAKPDHRMLPPGRCRLAAWLMLLLVGLLPLGPGASLVHAQQAISEMEAKARFMILTAPYVDWPAGRFASEESPIRIAVLGADELATELEKVIQAQKKSQRRFVVTKISEPEQAREAEMLFVGASESKQMGQITRALQGAPVLTFGETNEFFEDGGMIHLFLENGFLRCEINLAAAERAKLGLSSKLLTLAKRVVKEAK